MNPSPQVSDVSNSILEPTCTFPDLVNFRKRHSKNVIFAHLNINFFHSKYMEIQDILYDKLVDIFAISETKLNDTHTSEPYRVKDYSFYRMDRPGSVAGGGLVCYVNSCIPHTLRNELAYRQDGIESMVLEITMKKQKWFYIIVYRPPNVSVYYLKCAIEYMCDRCQAQGRPMFLFGDLNVDFLKEPNPLSSVLEIYGLTNIITGPTCFKNPISPTLNDVILTNFANKVCSSLNVNIGVSDHHNMILMSTKMYAPKVGKKQIFYRTYKNFNEDSFLYDLSNTPFHVSTVFDDVDDQLWFHSSLLSNVIDLHAPKKSKTIKPNQLPCMNGELRKAINVKGMLMRKRDKFPSKSNHMAFARQRNLVTHLKREAMKVYFDEHCNNNSNQNKTFWKAIQPFLSDKCRSQETITLQEGDNVIVDTKEVCNVFNEYFVNIASDLSETDIDMNGSLSDIVQLYDSHPSIVKIREVHGTFDATERFRFSNVTSENINKKLVALKVNKACGYDGKPPKLLKLGAPVLCLTLSPIINKCILENVFPSDYKIAQISPVFKKENKLQKEKYRPVSVLPSDSKVPEGMLSDQLTVFFSDKLSSRLSAYRQGYSTQHVLMRAVEDWKNALDDNKYVGIVMMDLSKAFDSLAHGLLLAKLYAYGLSMDALEMIRSYLVGRKQCVKIGNECSDFEIVQRGVPQGSIIGPLLFNVSINDLFYFLEGKSDLYNFADDNTMSNASKDMNVVKASLEVSSNESIEWFAHNFMQANASKFQVCLLSRNPLVKSLCLNVNGFTLQSEEIVKLLGIHIDNQLNFNYHVSVICKRAANQIKVLARMCNVFSVKSKMTIFNAFILANFLYCPLIWHYCGATSTRKVERLQERALRYIYMDFNSDYKTLLSDSKKSTLYINRLRTLAVEMYKILNDIAPEFLRNIFVRKHISYTFRDLNLLEMPKYKTVTYGCNSIAYQGSKLWNQLPVHLKEIEDVSHFKSEIKQWEGPKCRCGFCLQCTLS